MRAGGQNGEGLSACSGGMTAVLWQVGGVVLDVIAGNVASVSRQRCQLEAMVACWPLMHFVDARGDPPQPWRPRPRRFKFDHTELPSQVSDNNMPTAFNFKRL